MNSPCGRYLLRYYFRYLGETKVNTGTKPHTGSQLHMVIKYIVIISMMDRVL